MIDPTQDHEVFDGGEPLLFRQAGTGACDRIPHALRRGVSLSELNNSRGVLRQGDVRWDAPAAGLAFAPAPGDQFQAADGQLWTILRVEQAVFGTRFRCWSRNLILAEHLRDLVTWQTALWETDAEGAAVPHWIDQQTQLPARIQPLSAAPQTADDQQAWHATHAIYLSEALPIKGGQRLVCQGIVYEAQRVDDAQRLDRLFVVYATTIT